MHERIKKLRKTLDLTQKEFGERIGVKPNTIATYEIGRNAPIDAVISLICREFNVSEPWLRTGEGEMFVPQTRTDELSLFVNQLLQSESDDIRRRFVTAISRLSTKQLEVLEGTALRLADELNALAPDAAGQKRATSDVAARIVELERQSQEKDRQLQDLAAKVAAMEEEDALLGHTDVSSKSPSVSVGNFNPASKPKK